MSVRANDAFAVLSEIGKRLSGGCVPSPRYKSGKVVQTIGATTVLLSVPLFCEYEAKLKQPEIMEQHGLSEPDIDRVLDFFVDKALKVSFNFRWRPQLQDPNDEMVLETAVNGGARFIVTFNIKDFRRVAPRFGVAVEPPGAFLQRIKGEGKWDSTL